MNRPNEKVYRAARINGVPMWVIADRLQCHENTLYRRLRHELPDEEQERLVSIIEDIARKEQ